MLIQGSSTLYPPLLAAGLTDELVLMTFPVVLGTGKRLFGDGTPSGSLRLLDHQVRAKGVIVTRWAQAGPIRRVIGSDRDANGGYWQAEIPSSEGEWRGGSAVLNIRTAMVATSKAHRKACGAG
ncbi:dihydrofolate reductase family protein [Sphingomonas sp. PP-CE-1G-424]|uniref:dihydrofolate reductase family protein n=1 Tax=Sphingomonas sp. PP-CE-1G-424 TaxID=2135658 RepID=UPI001A9DDF02|nr:dihydrofolate reductase family protein [Sphingomonas sp. PP-CE-1G-424]